MQSFIPVNSDTNSNKLTVISSNKYSETDNQLQEDYLESTLKSINVSTDICTLIKYEFIIWS